MGHDPNKNNNFHIFSKVRTEIPGRLEMFNGNLIPWYVNLQNYIKESRTANFSVEHDLLRVIPSYRTSPFDRSFEAIIECLHSPLKIPIKSGDFNDRPL